MNLAIQPALSFRQPWAELIMLGRKTIEIRTWHTAYRGRLWVHASQRADTALDSRFGLGTLFRGGFIGSMRLGGIVPLTPDRWEGWRDRHLNEGPLPLGVLAWLIAEPKRFREPIAGRGQLGLFEAPSDLVRRLSDADANAITIG
jgi:hypothetical protein